jgi:hypothetical protein
VNIFGRGAYHVSRLAIYWLENPLPVLTVAENHVRKSLLLPASQMPLLEDPVLDSVMLPKQKQTSAKRTDAPATVE